MSLRKNRICHEGVPHLYVCFALELDPYMLDHTSAAAESCPGRLKVDG